MRGRQPKVAVFKLASCDGCLSLLDCEDELLALTGRVRLAHFLEATPVTLPGPYDLSLVEGSVTTTDDARAIQEIRRVSRRLVAIGACATAGGIQALRNVRDVHQLVGAVYPRPDFIATLSTSSAIADHVPVDFELRGCPVDKGQLLEVIAAFLAGRRPAIRPHSVCLECKRRGVVCVMVAGGVPCLGPVTHAGCGALCPAYARGCFGCFGPQATTRAPALARVWKDRLRVPAADLRRAFRTYNAGAPAFREASESGD